MLIKNFYLMSVPLADYMKMENKKMIAVLGMLVLVLLAMGPVSASMQLDNIYFDPAIVAAGDSVDVVVQYSVDSAGSNDRVANEHYTFGVELAGDDSLTEKYVTIVDAAGDSLVGRVFAGQHYNKVFRIKIADNAPVGDYQFELIGRWYFMGSPVSSFESMKFVIPVKKEGISLSVAGFSISPNEVRPGDDYVVLSAYIDNSGEKAAKSVEVRLSLPAGFKASYSDNNRVFAGLIGAGESRVVEFYINVDDKVSGGVYEFEYDFEFKDSENNKYTDHDVVEFYVKPRPYLEVVKVVGEGVKGSSSKMYVTIRNNGNETAESVDVRILKQSSQPFDFDVRSDYIGELMPGEEGVAIFDIDVTRSAEEKEYDLKLIIRAKGDSDDGDDNIYVFNRRAKFNVVSGWLNGLFLMGIVGAGGVGGYFVWKKKTKVKGKKKR